MKYVFLLFLIKLSFTACNNAPTNTRITSGTSSDINNEAKEERNKQAVIASTEAFIIRDVNGVAKDFAPDIMDHNDGARPPVKGVDSFKYYTEQFFKAVSDLKGENLHYVSEGDWVVVWGDWSGIWKGDTLGQNPVGKPFADRGADFFKFNEAGKVIEHYGIIQPRIKYNGS